MEYFDFGKASDLIKVKAFAILAVIVINKIVAIIYLDHSFSSMVVKMSFDYANSSIIKSLNTFVDIRKAVDFIELISFKTWSNTFDSRPKDSAEEEDFTLNLEGNCPILTFLLKLAFFRSWLFPSNSKVSFHTL